MTSSKPFDAQSELVSLFRAATNFDEKYKALALMEKVGGFFGKVKGEGADLVRDPDDQDPVAAKVRAKINRV